MPVKGEAANQSAISYITAVKEFKAAVRAGKIQTEAFARKKRKYKAYYPEPRGRRRGSRSGDFDYISRHGDIVDALFEWRRSRPMPKGGKCVKDFLIDMGVEVRGKLVELYEVKSSTDRSSMYSALGQLMVHSKGGNCKTSLVLPSDELIASDFVDALYRFDIDLIKFQLSRKSARIID